MTPAHISTPPVGDPTPDADGICHCDPQPDSSPLGECPQCHRLDVRTAG